MRTITALAIGGLVMACGGATESTAGTPTTTNPQPTTDAGPTDAASTTAPDAAVDVDIDAKLLESCPTSIAADAPELFKRYFRCVDVTVDGTDVVVHTKSLPPYRTYYYGSTSDRFIAFDTSRGAQYHPNPNVLAEQNVTVRIPQSPVPRAGLIITKELVDGQVGSALSKNDYKLGPVGVGLNGVSLYNGLAAPGADINNEKYTFDTQQGHPDQRSSYHYHSPSSGPLAVLARSKIVTTTEPGKAEVELYGVMCDGTLILGCTELDGSAPDPTALDAQGGHASDLADRDGAVSLQGRYHTHLCAKWSEGARLFTPEVQYYDRCSVQ